MSRFGGIVGFAIPTATNGVHLEVPVERTYYGDVNRNIRRTQPDGEINDGITISNQISIVADQYAYENYLWIRYAEVMGIKWKVNSVDVQYPRLILELGGLYHG